MSAINQTPNPFPPPQNNPNQRVGATWNLLSEDGVLITSRHEKLTPILLTPDPGDDPQLGKGRGYTNFYRCVFFLFFNFS